jgi:IS605 OrfB family transposase
VADTRRDWQHKLSTAIIRDNQAVYVEDLCVVGLGRTRLAKSVHDAGWSAFTGMLEYKAARYGRTFARVDRFFPSTRMCSDCGRINEKMALDVRAWDCPCGSTHDRDVNAARNIKAAGQADFNDRGAQVRPALVPAPRGETVTHPDAGVPHAAWRETPSFTLGQRGRQWMEHDRPRGGPFPGPRGARPAGAGPACLLPPAPVTRASAGDRRSAERARPHRLCAQAAV